MQNIYNANPEKIIVGMVGCTLSSYCSTCSRKIIYQQEDI
jgi:hypothetical protein